MAVYSVIMFISAVLFFIIGLLIYKGNTELIHDYHQSKVDKSDKSEYGKGIGKGLFTISISLFSSGIIGLFTEKVLYPVGILLIGLTISIGIILHTQNKYNKGIF